MKLKNFLFTLCLFAHVFPLASANASETIQFVGLNDDQQEIQRSLSQDTAKERLAQFFTAIEDQVDLLQVGDKAITDWNMKKFYLGMSLGASIGLGSIVKMSATPGFYLIFEKK